MKKALAIILVVVMVFAMAACGQSAAPAASSSSGTSSAPSTSSDTPSTSSGSGKTQFYSFVSSNAGALWYNMAGGAITLFNEQIPNVNFSLEASGGSTENAKRVSSGESDIGFTYANHLYEIYNGTGTFEGTAIQDAQILCQAYDSPHFFITLKSTGIKTIDDLIGKKVSLGPPGSGSLANSVEVLTALGMLDKVVGSEMSFADATRALQDGQIDAVGQSGYNSANVVELAATNDIYIIPYTDDQLTIIEQASPYFQRGIMPAGSYEGQDVDVPTFFFNVFLIAHKSVPADITYQILKVIFQEDNHKYLIQVHPSWADICDNPESVAQIGAQYHEGAIKYWSEQANG